MYQLFLQQSTGEREKRRGGKERKKGEEENRKRNGKTGAKRNGKDGKEKGRKTYLYWMLPVIPPDCWMIAQAWNSGSLKLE